MCLIFRWISFYVFDWRIVESSIRTSMLDQNMEYGYSKLQMIQILDENNGIKNYLFHYFYQCKTPAESSRDSAGGDQHMAINTCARTLTLESLWPVSS